MSSAKISIRFLDDREVRAVWDEQNAKWWFRVLDMVALARLDPEKAPQKMAEQ